jgi:aminomethyltransferase
VNTLNGGSLLRTPLHRWHVDHGARMVGFAGWSMPVQYPSGVTREHIATRTRAGLFDICHMGRFRMSGTEAASVLAAELTNDARELPVGRAHYTLLANERGGALDDAYLYRLDGEDFLLVVNAANRAADRARLDAACTGRSVRFQEVSAALGMLALQGPSTDALLTQVLGVAALPDPGRNRLRSSSFRGGEIMIARTGYTGERSGVEIFAPAELVLDLWSELVAAGAMPAGLGARDSLRLQAGLPLHGHELGADRNGRDIPIFAHRIGRFGVRPPGHGRFVGVEALDAQRAELDLILRDALQGASRHLPQLIQPIAAFGERRPLRAGYELSYAGEPVGYVTSGTSVPIIDPAHSDSAQVAMRPVGLALVRSDLRLRAEQTTSFEVRDTRGSVLMRAQLVESNLP